MTAATTDVRFVPRRPGEPCEQCGKRHRSWYTVAQCRWPHAIWISGNPPPNAPCFALASYCRPGATVTLWATLDEALQSKEFIDHIACGGRCHRDHRIYRMGA